ncbi:hypothetical protein V5799_016949, partial [Amblyomma americanum]
MNQRTYLGARLSVLDVAKDAVERFIKVRKTARRRLCDRTHAHRRALDFFAWVSPDPPEGFGQSRRSLHAAHFRGTTGKYQGNGTNARRALARARLSSDDDRSLRIAFQAGWKENHATFMSELKNLQASGLTTLGPALKNAFDLLNINRMQTGIDTYGQGRCPFYLEPSVLVVITDGNRLTSSAGVHEE